MIPVTKGVSGNVPGEQLESAFEMFNQLSEKLVDSYGDLESQVKCLSEELAVAHSERLIELTEKESLASKLEALLDAIPAGIIVLDEDERIIQSNPVARTMLLESSMTSCLEGKQWKSIVETMITTDGREFRLKTGKQKGQWLNLTVRYLGNRVSDSERGKIMLLTDITEMRDLQEKLNRQQRLSSLGEMVASLAHQIRTPLSSAILYLSTMNHPSSDESERTGFADKAKERLHHLERMVNDMLIFARGETTDSESINTYAFMLQLKYLYSDDHRIEEIDFFIDNKLKTVNIRANHDAVMSAIQNVVDNAILACKEKHNSLSRIVIDATLNARNQFEIGIEDNGCGMDEETKNKVLQPFFTTRSSGTGLGLPVVNSTVNRYQGELKIESELAVGSKFVICFPRREISRVLSSNLSKMNRITAKTENPDTDKQLSLVKEVAL